MEMQTYAGDRLAAAQHIAGILPELYDLSDAAGHDMLAYLLELAMHEARQISTSGEAQATPHFSSSADISATR